MASIQIHALRVVTACVEYIEKTELEIKKDSEYCEKNHVPKRKWLSEKGDEYLKHANKIKKLAEFEIDNMPVFEKPEGSGVGYGYIPTVTIDHNDFELIGDFIVKQQGFVSSTAIPLIGQKTGEYFKDKHPQQTEPTDQELRELQEKHF